MAYDSSNPNEISRANLTISVRRNENSPQFTPSVKTKTIPETFGLGRVIETMSATDNDNVSRPSNSPDRSSVDLVCSPLPCIQTCDSNFKSLIYLNYPY